MLACWFGPDRARLDRVFRRSALMRDRWDERYHDADHTYGDGIIDSALAGRADVSEPTRPPPRAAHADHPLHPSRRGEAGRSSERPGPSDRA
jgi:hypothetical protein